MNEKKTIPICEVINFNDYRLKDKDIEGLNLKLVSTSNVHGHIVTILYCKNSKVGYFQNKFWVVYEDNTYVYEIPIKNFKIQKIAISNFNMTLNILSLIVSNNLGKTQDLYNLVLENFFFNKQMLS